MAVVGHPARRAAAVALADEIDATLVMDEAGEGEWPTHERAWRILAETDASWGVVVQDDAQPIPGFRRHLDAVLRAAPQRTCIGLYVGQRRPSHVQSAVGAAIEQADQCGAGWLRASSLCWGVGVALPREQIAAVIDRPCERPYDERIGAAYWSLLGLPVLYTWPSLVDHADWPTLVEHPDGAQRSQPRCAHRVGVPAPNGLVVDL